MNRLDERFKFLKKKKEKALILFITAGDPSMRVTVQTLWFCQQAGVDCVELGIPFSDPLADGPVIQAASDRAVEKNIRLMDVLRMLSRERRRGLEIPVVLMSSVNPIHAMGFKNSSKLMKKSGVDGVIIPDLPYDEDGSIRLLLQKEGVHPVLMMTPTTEPKRQRQILLRSRGFVYYVSLIGLTGQMMKKNTSLRQQVQSSMRKSRIPVCVGFGISRPQHAKAVARFADGVIVGSALVDHLYRTSKKGLSRGSKRFIQSFVRAVKHEKRK